MATTFDSFELSSISHSTPLLYGGIIENDDNADDEPLLASPKVRVAIETPVEALPEKMVSDLQTKWTMKNGVFHFSDCDITDEWGNPRYHIDTSGFFLIDMKLKDLYTGFNVFTMKQRWGLMPKFDLYLGADETRYARVAMDFTWTRVKAKVTFDAGEPDLRIESTYFGREYTIRRGDVVVATCKRSFCTHSYEIAAGENLSLIHSLIATTDKMMTISRRKALNL